MKKLITLVVAACMVLGTLGAASAVDVKVKGQWFFHYGYYSNNTLTKNSESGQHSDRTRARQRIRTQVEFIADENLKAMLNLEANLHWGESKGTNGSGRLDADETSFVIKHAYLDWTIPQTDIKTRMGMQGLRMPAVVAGNPVMNADVAGVTVSNQFTPELGLTVFWARPFDDGAQTADQSNGRNLYDEVDLFGFMLPVTTDYVRATPWAMLAMVGKDSDYFGTKGVGSAVGGTGVGRGRAMVNANKANDQIYAWWAGTTVELPFIDPFVAKLDAMMGGIKTGDSDSNAFGYLVAGEFGYKFDFGTLTARGWYASGDKDQDDRGIMPIMSDDSGFTMTRYGMAGSYNRSYDRVLSGNGLGMWGIGLQLADVTFVDDLKHTVGVYYMGGTNEGDSVNRRSVRGNVGDSRFGSEFLMSSDRAWEIDLLNEYKVNQNLSVNLDFSYVWLDLGDHWTDKDDTKGSFAAMLGVLYSF